MNFQDLFKIKKWYNPDITEISEIDFTKKEVEKLKEKWERDSNSWTFTQVKEWLDSYKFKLEYIQWLTGRIL